ncbi:MAG: hypothetical protein J6S63_11760, partial [Atopobiaceae bacterium]|nr:hypothetical protein [Atopobiaceae bacterium]
SIWRGRIPTKVNLARKDSHKSQSGEEGFPQKSIWRGRIPTKINLARLFPAKVNLASLAK